jgi:hypothetical protein
MEEFKLTETSFVNLGLQGRSLATDDPDPRTVLPADDGFWDLGEMISGEPLHVSCPTSVKAGAFARTCQATHLLGRMIRILNDLSGDPSLRFTAAAQLHRTLSALSNLLTGEFERSPTTLSTPLSLCYAGLLHLCDRFCCTASNNGNATAEETEMQGIAIISIQNVAKEVTYFAQVLKPMMATNLAVVSPLIMGAIYMGAATYAWLAHESGSSDHVASYHTLREILVQMNPRWAVAGEYLKALDSAKSTLYREDPSL